MLRERDTQVAQAKENLARIPMTYKSRWRPPTTSSSRQNKWSPCRKNYLRRKEARRVSAQGLKQGTYLQSQAEAR